MQWLVMPVARMRFQSDGLAVLRSERPSTLPPYLASILEIAGQTDSSTSAFAAYSALRNHADFPMPKSPALDGGDGEGKALTLVGNKVFLSPVECVERAYELASAAYMTYLGTGARSDQNISKLLAQFAIWDLSEFSNASPVLVRQLAIRYGAGPAEYPELTEFEFGQCLDKLRRKGLLTPALGAIEFGDFHRHVPFCPDYGFSRGTPIDRFYLKHWLNEIREQVCGEVLEVGGRRENQEQYGFTGATTYRTLDLIEESGADSIGDVHDSSVCAAESLDSLVAFNVLEHCERPWVVAENFRTWLRARGKAFIIVPNAQRIHRDPADYWRILPDALASLFRSYSQVTMKSYGNPLTSIAALMGVAAEELNSYDLFRNHHQYPVISCLIAEK